MSDYTPTTDEVKSEYVRFGWVNDGGDEFDRWLNNIKAEIWDEGERASWGRTGSFEVNPYRAQP